MPIYTYTQGIPVTITALADRFPTGTLETIAEAVYSDSSHRYIAELRRVAIDGRTDHDTVTGAIVLHVEPLTDNRRRYTAYRVREAVAGVDGGSLEELGGTVITDTQRVYLADWLAHIWRTHQGVPTGTPHPN